LSKIKGNTTQLDEKEREFKNAYEDYYKLAEKNKRGFGVTRAYRYEVGKHPFKVKDLEFEFASYHLFKASPSNILDIGSYRHFIIGLLAHYNVTSVDIRERKSILANENIVTCDAQKLIFSDSSFDAVISLEALPHFGLCRYGDDFDMDSDIKVFNEMIRVLKPGGYLIFSTAITRAQPFIAFNARRNYSYAMIKEFCRSLECIKEKFIKVSEERFCSFEELTAEPNYFDYYIGCWQKQKDEL
jgi:SAM-dependent methyltransferase